MEHSATLGTHLVNPGWPARCCANPMINIAFPRLYNHLRNAGVVGSNPIGGTIFFNNLHYKFGSDLGQCIIQASTGQAL